LGNFKRYKTNTSVIALIQTNLQIFMKHFLTLASFFLAFCWQSPAATAQTDSCTTSFNYIEDFSTWGVFTFSNLITNPTDPVASWAWDFGDGTTSTDGPSVTHTYTANNTVNVVLTTTTQSGCVSSYTVTVWVWIPVNYTCQGYFNYYQDPIDLTGAVGFTAQLYSGSTDVTWAWDFGDGTTGTGATPSHTYATPGYYTVTLTGSSPDCETIVYVGSVNVVAPIEPCSSLFYSYSNLPYSPGIVFYSYQSDYSIVIDEWTFDFGDGTITTVTDPYAYVEHTYQTSGTYTVTLTTSAAGACEYTSTQQIEVIGADGCFTYAYYSQGLGGQVFFADYSYNSGTNATYAWDFGDGNTSTEQAPMHTYTTAGQYDVTMTMTNANNCVATTTTQVWMDEYFLQECYAYFNYMQITPADPLAVTFTDYSYGITAATDWSWNFGDGGTSTEKNPTHSFAAAGIYDVTLTSSNDDCESTIMYQVYVDPAYVVDICQGYMYAYQSGFESDSANMYFYASPSWYIYYLDPSVDWTSTYTFTWDFGDGTTGTGYYLEHEFPATGDYVVTLNMVSAATGCDYTVTQTVTVGMAGYYMEGCYASFYFLQDVDNANLLTFYDASYGNVVSASWDFGDGTTESALNPTHEYAEEGSYEVTLSILTADSCNSTITSSIWIGDYFWYPVGCQAAFNANIAGTTVTFMDMSTALSGVDSWSWDFGDGTTSTDPSPMHVYSGLAVYSVILTITTDGCTSSYQMDVDLINGLVGEGNMFFFLISGTEEATLNSLQVALAPNPTTGNTTLKFETTDAFDYQIDVVDISGRVLSSNEKSATRGKNTVEIEAAALQTGMYMVRLRSGDATKTVRFVKI
jgi:PKD repeat protein